MILAPSRNPITSPLVPPGRYPRCPRCRLPRFTRSRGRILPHWRTPRVETQNIRSPGSVVIGKTGRLILRHGKLMLSAGGGDIPCCCCECLCCPSCDEQTITATISGLLAPTDCLITSWEFGSTLTISMDIDGTYSLDRTGPDSCFWVYNGSGILIQRFDGGVCDTDVLEELTDWQLIIGLPATGGISVTINAFVPGSGGTIGLYGVPLFVADTDGITGNCQDGYVVPNIYTYDFPPPPIAGVPYHGYDGTVAFSMCGSTGNRSYNDDYNSDYL